MGDKGTKKPEFLALGTINVPILSHNVPNARNSGFFVPLSPIYFQVIDIQAIFVPFLPINVPIFPHDVPNARNTGFFYSLIAYQCYYLSP